MAEFRMPSLGSDMQEGTLLEWRVKPGDRVRRRDIIAVVDTDKAAIEIEVFEEGVIEEILVQPGQKVPVGTVLAIIRTEAETGVETAEGNEGRRSGGPSGRERHGGDRAIGKSQPAGKARFAEQPPPAAASGAAGRMKVSPYARRLAAERHIDLSLLEGTGPGGAIRAADVERRGGDRPSGAAGGSPFDAAGRKASWRAEGKGPSSAGFPDGGKAGRLRIPDGHAPCHCRRHGALQPRNPPLLSSDPHRHEPNPAPGSNPRTRNDPSRIASCRSSPSSRRWRWP